MLNKSYNTNYSQIIINNGKSIEPSLEEKITLYSFFELKHEIIEKIISKNKNLLNFIDESSGNSLLHISVLIAAFFHYIGCLDAYYSRFDHLC